MSDFISFEKIPEYLRWVVLEDPLGVQDILENGRRLENAHIKTPLFLWDRKKGPQEQKKLFTRLKNNEVLVDGQVRDYKNWCDHWQNLRNEQEAKKIEKRLQKRIENAKQKAIAEVRRKNPSQIFVDVIQEESPPRIEELADSDPGHNLISLQIQDQINVSINRGCCPRNTDCADENCALLHF